jgi:diguanylate cyclase (GGDEF)-like protein
VRIPTALRARDARSAARSAVLILAVCAVVLTALTVFATPPDAGALTYAASWSGVGLVAIAGIGCHLASPEQLDRVGACVLVAVAGVLLICTLNLLTDDTSAAAQAFLAFPILWAASHLRRAAAALVTGTAVLLDTVTLFLLLPAQAAATDAVFFGAVLVVMADMLVRAGATQDRLVAALQEQATVDSLTGLVNRRVFDEALETALGSPVPGGTALVLIDVDAFKTINDSYGHPVGDDVLVHLAAVLRGEVRAEDAVLSRLGGDELAVLLPGCTAEVASRRAQELLEAVRSSPMTLPDGMLLSLSISLGVAHVAQRSGALGGLYSAADSALYEAKRNGRGRVAVASA